MKLNQKNRGKKVQFFVLFELFNDTGDGVKAKFEFFNLWAEADAAVIFVARVRTAVAGVHVEKHAGHDDDFFLQTFAEKIHAVIERRRQLCEISPNVKRPGGRSVRTDAEFFQP